jgi:hypothetical protein
MQLRIHRMIEPLPIHSDTGSLKLPLVEIVSGADPG